MAVLQNPVARRQQPREIRSHTDAQDYSRQKDGSQNRDNGHRAEKHEGAERLLQRIGSRYQRFASRHPAVPEISKTGSQDGRAWLTGNLLPAGSALEIRSS